MQYAIDPLGLTHFYLVHSLCNKPDLQFQCDDGAACIAIYDVCNGVSECNDGSDEVACENGNSCGSMDYHKC